MDNQHRKIKGYRELSQEEIDTMNRVKELGAEVGELVNEMKRSLTKTEKVNGDGENYDTMVDTHDRRWLEIAQTDLQKGFMALTRSIAKPDFF